MQYKSSFKDATFSPEKQMAAAAAGSAPIAVGTRGTVGSLLKKEIEYFAKFEIDTQVEMDCSNGQSRPGFWFSVTGWNRRKRRACNKDNSGFLPSMCSAIEVADMNRFNRIPGFNYRILKNDVHNFHV